MKTLHDTDWMQRALALAEYGRGAVSPNPLVGCVLVSARGQVIGEGWHRAYGSPHAEIHALDSVPAELREQIRGCTVYVTLEPCAHYGKTPPCADRLIAEGVGRVVIGLQDPFPQVNGRGSARLQAAGIAVETGLLAQACQRQNAAFLTFHQKKRPYIILKWAQTADGLLARADFSSKWISDAYSRRIVHQWRSQSDAILIGTNTLRYDDPQLNVRQWVGKSPVRLVIDRKLRHYPHQRLFDGTQPTRCYNHIRQAEEGNNTLVHLSPDNELPQILNDLYQSGLALLLVEGGAGLHEAFLSAGLWDELRVFTARHSFGAGVAAPRVQGHLVGTQALRQDRLDIYLKNIV
ncbi:MAG: bifunctional diaminohydroxyphosphoribosylaminopyrimidine deaminase/5-amino-6-(5-phosphoribosylamino)uracil reductase RibD [Bernardetiaceae bacterium]